MEIDMYTKIIFGLVTAVGTGVLAYFNFSQTRKVTAELLEKFEIALEKSQKHSVTELFRLIHGLRMSYSDIVELVKHNDCSKIIFALKKTPNVVCYQDGTFKYTPLGKNSIFKFIDVWMSKAGIVIFSFIALFGTYLLMFKSGGTSFIGFVFMVFSSAMIGIQLRQKQYDQMVAKLVGDEI